MMLSDINRTWCCPISTEHDAIISTEHNAIRCQPNMMLSDINRTWCYPMSTEHDVIRCEPNIMLSDVNRTWCYPISTEHDAVRYQPNIMLSDVNRTWCYPISTEHNAIQYGLIITLKTTIETGRISNGNCSIQMESTAKYGINIRSLACAIMRWYIYYSITYAGKQNDPNYSHITSTLMLVQRINMAINLSNIAWRVRILGQSLWLGGC